MILKNGKRIDGLGDNMPIGSIVEYNGTDIPDGWEILPGDANVYVGLEQPTEGQEIWVSPFENLYDEETCLELSGQFRDHNHGTITSGPYYNGIKIPVEPSTYYLSASNIDYGSWSNLCFFDENMTYISGLAYNVEDKIVRTPANCAYVTIALLKSAKWFMFSKIDSTTLIKTKQMDESYKDLIDSVKMGLNPEGAKIWLKSSDNILDLRSFTQTSTKNGITIRYLGNVVEVAGTSTAQTQTGYLTINKRMDCHSTLVSSPSGERSGVYIKVQVLRGSTRYYWDANGGACRLEEGDILEQIYFIVESGKTVKAHYQLKLERGWDYTPEYEGYIDNNIYIKNKQGFYEEYFSGGDIYSTEEHKIGRWVNGKPIYRKCFTLDTRIALGNGHTKMTTLAEQGIVDWEDITHISFTVKDDHSGYFSDGFYTDETDASRCWVSSDWVMFLCGTTYGCGDTTFIIEYTKTTD